jgi:recombination protein RecA
MAVRPEDYDEIVARINKKYENDIRRGNQFEIVPRISTGSLELDLAMGGGVPVGRWTRFYGGFHSTKTLTALQVIAEAQELGFSCAYYNVEKQYDPIFAQKKLGVDVDELTLVEGATIEEIGEKMEAMFQVCHVHVIDSCTMAVSEDELNADVRDWRPGLNSRSWGKVFRRLNERFDQMENTVILIDQMRVDFKTGSEQAAGGRVFDYQSSMSVLFRKGKWIFRNKEGFLDDKAPQEKGMSGQIEPAGYEVKARVEKSRVCRPFRSAVMRLDLDSLKFDRVYEVIKAGVHFGMIRQSGPYYYYEHDGEEMRFQGSKKLRAFLEEHPDVVDDIREKSLIAINR